MSSKRAFKKVLIANRGEIALRAARACRELQISPVGCFTSDDESGGWIRALDEAYELKGLKGRAGYLNIEAILEIAKKTKADAVHPGYGFLSEQAAFAEACQEAGVVFIGPSPHAMAEAGDKITARKTAQKLGIPCLPGTSALSDWKEALLKAEKIGYPVLLKAAAGGGGHGMRLVTSSGEMEASFLSASHEALSSFGDGTLYLEKYLLKPRHIEIQILADQQGHLIWLGERECSVQRRHQKLIEESPSCAVNEGLREKMGEKAVHFSKEIGYTGAGTVEFLLDGDNFYFLEMNARIQVEHPVTEMVTGIDLVKSQIEIAEGYPLPLGQEEVQFRGWSFEARINCEDPMRNFIPSPGCIEKLFLPGGPGVRIDTAVYPGYNISEEFDSLFAKLIVWGRHREEAVSRMKNALLEFEVSGIPTTIPFHYQVFSHPVFQKGDLSTRFIEDYLREPCSISEEEEELAAILAALEIQKREVQFENSSQENRWALAGRMRNVGIYH